MTSFELLTIASAASNPFLPVTFIINGQRFEVEEVKYLAEEVAFYLKKESESPEDEIERRRR